MSRLSIFPVVASLALLVTSSLSTTPALADEPSEKFAALEAALSGASLVGQFTVSGKEQVEPKPERYEILEVKHLEGDSWLFQARIKYGERDVTLPLTLPVKWAGDTPVITIDEMAFPGLGTYSARVMIYDDHYAGYWSGATHGGHLFGVVERNDSEASSDGE